MATSDTDTLLVTGASGHLGQRVLHHLVDTLGVPGSRIIATTRKPVTLADWAEKGVTVRASDFDNPASLVTAFDLEKASTELTEYGDKFTHDDLWKNMEYFLRAVVPEAEKKEDLAQLEATLKNAKPIRFKENIALVLKYFDKLAPLMQEQDLNLRPAD